MSLSCVYQINNALPIYNGTLTLLASRLAMAYNRQNNDTNAQLSKLNRAHFNGRFSSMQTYYTA